MAHIERPSLKKPIRKTYQIIPFGPSKYDLKRNKTLSRVLKYNKTHKRLCVYDRYEIFRPFFGKYKGIQKSFLLQKDDKVVLLIGEKHSLPDLGGFARLSSILDEVMDALNVGVLDKTNSTLDFFLEITQDETCIYRKNAYYGKYSNSEIDILRSCVSPYIPFLNKNPKRRKNVRFHFADYEHKGGTIEDFTKIFNGSDLFTYSKFFLKDPEDISIEMSDYMNKSTVDLYKVSLTPSISNDELSKRAVDLFLKEVKDDYAGTGKEDKFTRHGCDKYRDVFVECLTVILNISKYSNFRLFLVYRFFMDMYSLCRLMRKEGNFYKNIIYYSGYAHTESLHCMLIKLGFKEVEIDDLNSYDVR